MGRGSFENTVVTASCDCDPLSGLTPSAALRFLQDAATAGNGRLARNKLEQAILNQSRRLVAEPNAPLDLLLWTDFELEE